MANGKAKGSQWERDISRFLTEWLTCQKKDLYYYRSPSSGAVATVNEMYGEISGDIISIKPEGRILTDIFSIEAKNGYPAASFDKHLRYNKSDDIESFWDQATTDAKNADKEPMLIFKKKGCPPIVGIRFDFFVSNIFKLLTLDVRYVTLSYGVKFDSVVFFDLKEFFNNIKPKDIENIRNAIN